MSDAPCSNWIDGVDVMNCLGEECDNPSLLNTAATMASELLFSLSGRKYAGECERTVRPCRTRCACDGWQQLSRGFVVNGAWWWWNGWSWWFNDSQCGCRALSQVRLSGYPVREITQVLIDGDVVDPATYRLDRRRFLVRVRDPADPDVVLMWPACQALDLPDTEQGTFSVTYTYGEDPPVLGVQAAGQLGAELFKACSGGPCALPKGAVTVTRQGVTISKVAIADWVFVPTKLASRGSVRTSGWRTGLELVDAFLNSANPNGLMRRPTFWSPAATLQYPLPEDVVFTS